MNGFNPNSLVLGGLYQNNNITPSPIGNMMSLSPGYNQGTMGGYYNPTSSYSNPYLEHQRKQKLEIQMKEEQRTQGGIWKVLSKNVNKTTKRLSDEEIDDHVKKYDPVFDNNSEERKEFENYMKLSNLHTLHKQGVLSGPMVMNIDAMNREIEKVKSVVADDAPLDECLEKIGSLFLEDYISMQKLQQKDISKLYNQKEYGDLIKMHSGASNYYNSILTRKTPLTTDDLEIQLPSHLNTEYAEKKRQFIDAIMGNK